jgi:hypothetical protein
MPIEKHYDVYFVLTIFLKICLIFTSRAVLTHHLPNGASPLCDSTPMDINLANQCCADLSFFKTSGLSFDNAQSICKFFGLGFEFGFSNFLTL